MVNAMMIPKRSMLWSSEPESVTLGGKRNFADVVKDGKMPRWEGVDIITRVLLKGRQRVRVRGDEMLQAGRGRPCAAARGGDGGATSQEVVPVQAERKKRLFPRGPRRKTALPRPPVYDFWHPELKDNISVLFQASALGAICSVAAGNQGSYGLLSWSPKTLTISSQC